MVQLAATIAMIMLIAAMTLAFVRLVRGPTLADRILALDMMSMLVLGLIAAHVIRTNQPMILDAAIVVALITFLGTVAFARYLAKGALRRSQP